MVSIYKVERRLWLIEVEGVGVGTVTFHDLPVDGGLVRCGIADVEWTAGGEWHQLAPGGYADAYIGEKAKIPANEEYQGAAWYAPRNDLAAAVKAAVEKTLPQRVG